MKTICRPRWKEIPGWPQYEVSNQGAVRRDGRLLKLVPVQSGSSQGYRPLRVSLSDGARRKDFKVAHLVLLTFRGPAAGRIARHRDDRQDNNWLSNLEWGTHAQNGRDRVLNNRHCPGERNGNSKGTVEIALAIRREYVRGSSSHGLAALSRRYNLSIPAVHSIIARKTWKEI